MVKSSRVGLGIDIHQFEEKIGKKLILGGVHIPNHIGLKGHSDADVVLHALVDAILGALSLGDIGDFFPPSDAKWKNADSTIFVKFALSKVKEYNASINNIDIVLLAETPVMYPFKDKIKANIAKLLHIDMNQINFKATTSEKMGFVGRNEGICCHVIISLSIKNE